MSGQDEDDSARLQEKLLSTQSSGTLPSEADPSSSAWLDGEAVGVHGVSSGNRGDTLYKKNGASKKQEPLADIDPDRCYSWLLAPGDGTASGKRSRNDSEASISSSSSSSLPMPQAPDGGWGWFVVFGAFTVTLICDGLSYCFGVLYAELLVQFEESRSKTSLVGSIFFGVAMILGPLASALTTRFGCRTMTIFGGLLASLGLFLSFFATSIEMLCFTFSVIVGTGFSFCYITSVVIVAFYFDKRRALATGLAVCGTGVGTFTFAPLMDYLIVEYGWRGLFLIMAGISLNLVVCGMLFRPLQFTESERWEMLLEEFNKIPFSREDIELSRNRYQTDSSESNSDDESLDEEQRTLSMLSLPTFVTTELLHGPSSVLMEALKNSRNPHHTLQRYMRNAMLQSDHNNSEQKSEEVDSPVCGSPTTDTSEIKYGMAVESDTDTALGSVPASLPEESFSKLSMSPICHTKDILQETSFSDRITTTSFSLPKITDKLITITPRTKKNTRQIQDEKEQNGKTLEGKNHAKGTDNQHHKRHEFSGMSNILTDKGCEKEAKSVVKRIGGVHIGRHNALGIHLPLYRTDIFYRRLLKNVPLHKRYTLGTSCPEMVESIAPEAEKHFIIQALLNFLEESSDIMKSMVELRLFLNPFFIVFVISNFLFYFWSDVPYMYAADHAMDNGIDQQRASFLLSVVGIFNTIGQMVFGYIGDMNINLLNVYAVVSSIAGLFVAVIPLMGNYIWYSVMYALFGFFISVSYPLTTVLLVQYLGVGKLTNAYGLLMLVQGIANFLGPPLAGWVSDVTGNYDSTFYLSGFFYAVSGVVLFVMYFPKCREHVRSRRSSLDSSIEVP
ncbi:unnamed protein product [Candidula unifasciata]|uniref:Major facilitator superfamily (MFS) profile domain-containing protein n=1 Tax=Candidula unifasciata TaxID=100452 RepID=A0A8S3YWQ5_9EUPU|nr:unnamed protein product [Candidula unifasciata]